MSLKTKVLTAAAFAALLASTAVQAVTYTVGTGATYRPFEYEAPNKEIVGFDIDLMKAIAKAQGFDVEFVNTTWSTIFPALNNGDRDIIMSGITITDKRKKAYVFSDPYYEVHQAVVVAKDSAIKKPEDLKGKKVGVQIGTTAIEALRKMNVDIDLRTYDEVGLVFEDMRNGRLDVVVCDDPVARYYASRKEGYKDLMKVAFLTEDVEYIGFVFSKDNAELAAQVNKGLKAIRENGKEKAIRNKWLGE